MQLELYIARDGVEDTKIVIDMVPSEYKYVVTHEYVEFGGAVYKNYGTADEPQFLSIHPYKIRGV